MPLPNVFVHCQCILTLNVSVIICIIFICDHSNRAYMLVNKVMLFTFYMNKENPAFISL